MIFYLLQVKNEQCEISKQRDEDDDDDGDSDEEDNEYEDMSNSDDEDYENPSPSSDYKWKNFTVRITQCICEHRRFESRLYLLV